MKNLLFLGLALSIFTGCAHNHKNVILEKEGIVKSSDGVSSTIILDNNTEFKVNKKYKAGEKVKVLVK